MISLVSSQYSFKYLSQFNAPKESGSRKQQKRKHSDTESNCSDDYDPSKSIGGAEDVTEEIIASMDEIGIPAEDDAYDLDLETALEDVGDIKVSWNPPLPKHLYYDAKAHYLANGFAFAPLQATIARRQRLDPAMVQVLEEFLTSNEIIMDTAYGTRKVKDGTGETHVVARVIR